MRLGGCKGIRKIYIAVFINPSVLARNERKGIFSVSGIGKINNNSFYTMLDWV